MKYIIKVNGMAVGVGIFTTEEVKEMEKNTEIILIKA